MNNRTLFLLIASCFLFCQLCYGQFYIAPKYGFNGVVSFSEIKDATLKKEQGKQFGIELGRSFLSILSIKGEILYTNDAYALVKEHILINQNQQEYLLNESVAIKNGSLSTNVALSFDLGKFELAVGPQLDALFSSKGNGSHQFAQDSSISVLYNYLEDDAGEGAYWNYPLKPDALFENSKLGLNVGLSFELFRNFYVEARTNYKWTDLINKYYTQDLSVEQFDLLLNLSYRVPIKKRKKKEKDAKSNDEEEFGFLGY